MNSILFKKKLDQPRIRGRLGGPEKPTAEKLNQKVQNEKIVKQNELGSVEPI